MAYETFPSRPFENTWLGKRLVSRWPELGAWVRLHRKYRSTLDELSSLSDRELTDIGMHRSNIREIAKEHVYGR